MRRKPFWFPFLVRLAVHVAPQKSYFFEKRLKTESKPFECLELEIGSAGGQPFLLSMHRW